MAVTIEKLKEKNIWFVCADMKGELMYRLSLTGPIGLVIGNEGSGVSRLVRENCDLTASIPMKGDIERRKTGSLVAFETGEATAYGIGGVQDRGSMFIAPGTPVYGGMIVGACNRNEDMAVNVCKKKQLTNMRAAGSDEAIRLVPPRQFSLEQCLEYLADDELLEVTPKTLRMRKRILDHSQRMRELMKSRNG